MLAMVPELEPLSLKPNLEINLPAGKSILNLK